MKLNRLVHQLANIGIDNPGLEALIMLEMASGLTREVIISGDVELTDRQKLELTKLVRRRRNEPLAYLTGFKEFYGHTFLVNKYVLIPRPESEAMIEIALGLNMKKEMPVVDVGCGSGCLGITYMLENKLSDQQKTALTLLDISSQALKVAKHNCQQHKISARYVKQSVCLASQQEWLPKQGLILANLPYLPINERETYEHQSHGLKAEPSIALYTDDEGLYAYKCLFSLCQNRNLAIVTEALPGQHGKMVDLARRNNYQHVKTQGLAQLFRGKE